MKVNIAFVLIILALGFSGCASMERGGIFYVASTPEAKTALSLRIEVLRAALRGDARLKEEVTRYYPLRFFGVKGTEFYGYLVTYSPHASDSPDDADLIVVGCAYDTRDSDSVRHLQRLINNALGQDVLRQLVVDSRYSPFVQNQRKSSHPQAVLALANRRSI
jgi:hypothetical protein